jgi:hypothetical protein
MRVADGLDHRLCNFQSSTRCLGDKTPYPEAGALWVAAWGLCLAFMGITVWAFCGGRSFWAQQLRLE